MAGFKLSEAYVEITARLDSLAAQVQAGGPAAQLATRGGTLAAEGFAQAFNRVLATVGVTVGIAGLVRAMRSSVSAALEDETSQIRLHAALMLTGKATTEVTERAEAFVHRIADTTVYLDDEIRSAMAFAATLGQFVGPKLEEVTRVGIGLANVFGTDIRTGVELATKAAQGAYGLFARYGLVLEGLTQGEKWAKITELAQRGFAIQGELANSAAGQFQRARNELHELNVALGEWILHATQAGKAAEGLRLLLQGPPSPETRAEEFGIAGDSPAMQSLQRQRIALQTRLQEAQLAQAFQRRPGGVVPGELADMGLGEYEYRGLLTVPTEKKIETTYESILDTEKKIAELKTQERQDGDAAAVEEAHAAELKWEAAEKLARFKAQERQEEDQATARSADFLKIRNEMRMRGLSQAQIITEQAGAGSVRGYRASEWSGWRGELGAFGGAAQTGDAGTHNRLDQVKEEIQGLRGDIKEALQPAGAAPLSWPGPE